MEPAGPGCVVRIACLQTSVRSTLSGLQRLLQARGARWTPLRVDAQRTGVLEVDFWAPGEASATLGLVAAWRADPMAVLPLYADVVPYRDHSVWLAQAGLDARLVCDWNAWADAP